MCIRDSLRSLLDHQSEEEFNNSRFQVLTELTRLRQICCDPALCFEDYGDETAKTDACMELVQSAVDGGHRLLVFSQLSLIHILYWKQIMASMEEKGT